jgi:hypothetical protein
MCAIVRVALSTTVKDTILPTLIRHRTLIANNDQPQAEVSAVQQLARKRKGPRVLAY